jgi:predicted short-subunit dehydrogenase-like oxidoreductase (DUF2520 family)
MKVVIIGSGNVATILALKLKAINFNIVQVYSLSLEHANSLASKVNASATNYIDKLHKEAAIYFLAVTDNAVIEIANKLQLPNNAIIVHTAGAVSKQVLANCTKNFGVFYPIQSIRKNMCLDIPIPFAIDGNNDFVINTLTTIAKQLQQTFVFYNDEQRLKLHVAAVIASNFVNYLYKESATFCKNEKIDFSILLPLIEETATRLNNYQPNEVFTGPAVRKDYATIEKHLQLLNNHPEQLMLYKFLTNKILQEEKY